nr:thioester reductase domain-containing protein [Ramlibacter sp.]
RSQGAAGGGGAGLRKLLAEAAPEQYETVVLEAVRAEVAKALEFDSPQDVDVSLPLQDIGVDSLTAVLLRNQLSDMTGLALPAKIAFDHPNLRSLSQFLFTKIQESGLLAAAAAATEPAAPKESAGARRAEDKGVKKGHLEPELQFKNAPKALTRPQAVFLTGATGFVGAFLLHELLKSNVPVHCLVRARDEEHGSARLTETLDDYGLWDADYAHLLKPVVGDLTQHMFGMAEDAFNQLADEVDAICHSGALVDWMLPLETYLGPNVVGTHEALRLASRGRGKVIHFVSTAATLPKYLGYEVSKDVLEYGYLTSKFMAEQMVAAARYRGAQASIYRLPFVGASSSSGGFRLDQGDFLHNLISGCIGLGSFPSLDTQLGGVLPVDYLARTITQAMTQDFARIGRNYDFVNPKAPTFNDFVELVRAAGADVETVPFTEWKARALQYAKAHPKSSLARISAVVDSLQQKDFESMEGTALGSDVFGGDNYPCPPVSEESVQPYVDRISAALMSSDLKPDAARSMVAQPA